MLHFRDWTVIVPLIVAVPTVPVLTFIVGMGVANEHTLLESAVQTIQWVESFF